MASGVEVFEVELSLLMNGGRQSVKLIRDVAYAEGVDLCCDEPTRFKRIRTLVTNWERKMIFRDGWGSIWNRRAGSSKYIHHCLRGSLDDRNRASCLGQSPHDMPYHDILRSGFECGILSLFLMKPNSIAFDLLVIFRFPEPAPPDTSHCSRLLRF